jgi:hypothetical protein
VNTADGKEPKTHAVCIYSGRVPTLDGEFKAIIRFFLDELLMSYLDRPRLSITESLIKNILLQGDTVLPLNL